MLKTIQKETNCYQKGFFKDIKALFNEKMPQIQTQNDKKTRKLRNFLEFFCNFCLFFEKLGGLECQRR